MVEKCKDFSRSIWNCCLEKSAFVFQMSLTLCDISKTQTRNNRNNTLRTLSNVVLGFSLYPHAQNHFH